MTIHRQLDIDHWIGQLPSVKPRRWWQLLPAPAIYDCEIVHGPLEVAAVELWRRAHPAGGKSTPTDWFVWSTEPAEFSYLTRLGGVPHRESSLAWPRNPKGQPRVFLGQICFLDSLDIARDPPPGDTLLIFGNCNERGHLDWQDYHLEWSIRDLKSPLLHSDVPTTPVRIPRLTGVIHRTVEEWLAPRQGTKIGQRTLVIQDDDDSISCSLSFFNPRFRWPTVDHQHLNRREARALGKLRLGDAGCIYVRSMPSGELRCWSDCY